VRDKREIIRDEMIIKKKIIDALKNGPKTVPEVANMIEKPLPEVMYWMMAMRKYAQIVETDEITEEGYYKYKLLEGRK